MAKEQPTGWGMVFHKAKLSTVEVSKILGVSRVTVSLWKNEHHEPHHLHKHKIDLFLRLVDRAVAGKLLPFDKKGLSLDERVRLIRKALQCVA